MHAIAHGGCTDPVRESTLKAGSGRKKSLAAPGAQIRVSIVPGFSASRCTNSSSCHHSYTMASFFLYIYIYIKAINQSFLFCPVGGRPGSVHQQEQPREGFEL